MAGGGSGHRQGPGGLLRLQGRSSLLRIGLRGLAAATLLLLTHRAGAGPVPALPPGATLISLGAAARTAVDADRPGPTEPNKPDPPNPNRTVYRVRSGDSWLLIAERHGVTQEQLRAWNPTVDRLGLRTKLTIEVGPNFQPSTSVGLDPDRDPAGLRLVAVPYHGESRGHPSLGRLVGGVQLPNNPSLYLIRRPEFAYGSSHAVRTLQLAIAKFRADSEYQGPLVISDMSKKRGGRFAPHDSHQSGRDVDIWLPLRAELVDTYLGEHAGELSDGTLNDWDLGARRPRDIDWRATLALIKALVRTSEVRYIFLSRGGQRLLYRAARAEGLPDQVLSKLIEFPRRDKSAVVRHAPRHGMHMHVRFRCAPDEPRCY